MTNILSELQEAIARKLDADPWFAQAPGIKVVTENRGDLDSQINERLDCAGLVVVVRTARAVLDARDGSDTLNVTVLLGVAERSLLNRGPAGTRKPALDVCVSCIALLNRFDPGNSFRALVFSDMTEVDGPEDLVSYQLRFETAVRIVAEQEDE